MAPLILFVSVLQAAGQMVVRVVSQHFLLFCKGPWIAAAIQAFSSYININNCHGLSCSCEEAGVYGYF